MSDDQLRKFTWGKDDVDWEFIPDPSAKPLIAPDKVDAAREALRRLRDGAIEPSDDRGKVS